MAAQLRHGRTAASAPSVVRRQRDQLRRSLRGLAREGFRTVHVLRSPTDEVAAATHRPGEAAQRLPRRARPVRRDRRRARLPGRARGAARPAGLRRSLATTPVERSTPVHPGRSTRRLRRRPGRPRAGLARRAAARHGHGRGRPRPLRTRQPREQAGPGAPRPQRPGEPRPGGDARQLAAEPPEFRAAVEAFCYDLVSHLVLDDGRLVVAHAGLKEAYHGRASGRVRSFCAVRRHDRRDRRVRPAGALPVGQRLPRARRWCSTATRRPRRRRGSTTRCASTPAASSAAGSPRFATRRRSSSPCRRSRSGTRRPSRSRSRGRGRRRTAARATPTSSTSPTCSGKRDHRDCAPRAVVSPGGERRRRARGHEPVRAAPALAALSAADHGPVATSARPDLLEHPAEAFEAYDAARRHRIGLRGEAHGLARGRARLPRRRRRAGSVRRHRRETGALYTRTGRSFFDPTLTEALLAAVRAAVGKARLWTSWAATGSCSTARCCRGRRRRRTLLRDQYAVGRGSRADGACRRRSTDWPPRRRAAWTSTSLAARTDAAPHNAEAFAAAYRRYCWADRRHSTASSLRRSSCSPPGRGRSTTAIMTGTSPWPTGSWPPTRAVPAPDGASAGDHHRRRLGAGRVDWWTELIAVGRRGHGGEAAGQPDAHGKGLVQPGLKVRGPEYLRIIYGPDYTEPANLTPSGPQPRPQALACAARVRARPRGARAVGA